MRFLKPLICLIIATLLIVFLSACGETDYHSETDQNANILTGSEDRFIRIANGPYTDIVYDKETGVEYIRSQVNSGYTYTVLLNSDGTPYVYPNYEKNGN